jgi:plastocyanin
MRFLTSPTKVTIGGALKGAIVACAVGWPEAGAAEGVVTHRVVIEKFAFRPSTLRIRAGDTVIFVNRDLAPHTATGVGGTWATKTLARGASARVVFAMPGRTAYFCNFHPGMKGVIVVMPR